MRHNRGFQAVGMRLKRHRNLALLAAALLLHGCGSSSTPGNADSGPPVVDAQGCTAYGDPPRGRVTLHWGPRHDAHLLIPEIPK